MDGRLIRPVVVAIVICALLLTCFKIISYGYLPVDDALRHAAKVVSGSVGRKSLFFVRTW